MSRVLGTLRLSRDTDESTSIVRQRRDQESWAERNDHTIIGWAEDLDVSGGISPFDRPDLGPWLTDERCNEYDIISAWKLDRLSRRLFHTFDLLRWAEDKGKTVVAVEDKNFDLSTPMGKALMAILAAIAEGELEAIRERARSSFTHLMRQGRWRGGFVPYGYRPAKGATGDGWRLEVDPETSAIVKKIAARIIGGASTNSVVRWLNEEKIPSSLDAQRLRAGKKSQESEWRVANLLKMLRSHTLLGYAEMTETKKLPDSKTERVTRLVRGTDGLPLLRAEPILTRADWDKLQAKLVENGTKKSGNRHGGSPLLRVAYCECGEPMYRNKGRNEMYYRCGLRARAGRNCEKGNGSIPAKELESAVEEAFLFLAGDLELMRRVFVPGSDTTSDLADIERALGELREDRTAGLYSGEDGSREFRQMYRRLEDQRTALKSQPSRPDAWILEPTGETYRQRWESLVTPADRGSELRSAGIKAIVHAKPTRRQPSLIPGEPLGETGRVVLWIPSDLRSRVEKATSKAAK